MSINRAPYNALVDDAGTGTTGTPWNKQAIKDVLLDPIDAADAAIAAAVRLTVLGSTSGQNTSAVPSMFTNVNLVPLSLTDRLVVHVTLVNGSGGPVDVLLRIYDAATTAFVQAVSLTGATGVGTMGSGNVGTFVATLQPVRPAGANVETLVTANLTYGTTQNRGVSFGALSVWSAPTAGNVIYLMHNGVTGGPIDWTWSVYLLKG